MADFRWETRGEIDLAALEHLFARAWDGHGKGDYDQVLDRSFTWVTAHYRSQLIGFVKVAWDGGVHFFLLDTTVHPDFQRRGIGTAVVRTAINSCRGHGEWLHVDSDQELMQRLYLPAGFAEAIAGTVNVES